MGNEKDEGAADTVGTCSLRVEHVKLHETYNGKKFVVEFDFLGKDAIRYHKFVEVGRRVYNNVKMFMDNKQDTEKLFDRITVIICLPHI